MKKRKQCQNKDCGVLFTPCPQVPGQTYCSRKACQQARKNEWNQKKLVINPAYREERQADHECWVKNNPNYWKDYRARSPDYAQKNRDQQRIRNQKRRKKPLEPVIAKTDESIPVHSVITGRYKLIPVHSHMIAKTDEYIVEIATITVG